MVPNPKRTKSPRLEARTTHEKWCMAPSWELRNTRALITRIGFWGPKYGNGLGPYSTELFWGFCDPQGRAWLMTQPCGPIKRGANFCGTWWTRSSAKSRAETDIGVYITTNTTLGFPHYDYSIIYPKTSTLFIQAPILHGAGKAFVGCRVCFRDWVRRISSI